MSRKKGSTDLFVSTAVLNNLTYQQYIERLTELTITVFEWKNLPFSVDARYIELKLFENGSAIYFNDEVMGNLCLDCVPQGRLNVYGYPINRRAYSGYNNFQKELNENDSVIIWNNYMHTNSVLNVRLFARKLYTLDRIIDVNANAQKTPNVLLGTEKQRLTLLNLYKEYEGNEPFIFGDKNLDLNALKVLQTGAPYVADKLYELKTQIWNEFLTYIGISNISAQKKERMITDEVTRNLGGTIASRYSRLNSRREAVEKINVMFGTNIEVNYREDFQNIDEIGNDTLGGDEDE